MDEQASEARDMETSQEKQTQDAKMQPVNEEQQEAEQQAQLHEQEREEQQQNEEPARRMVKMRQVLARALIEIGAQVPLKTFGECFPDYAERRRADMKRARKDLLNQLTQNVIDESEHICGEVNLADKLLVLEQLIAKQPVSLVTGKRRPFAEVDPISLAGSRILEEKLAKKQELKDKLQKIEEENQTLRNSVVDQRKHATALIATLEQGAKAMEEAAALCA